MARILIVGGSLGGLMAGGMLQRAGHDVQVLERSAGSLQGRGAGIVTHERLRRALRAAGATVDATLGIGVDSRVVLDATGAVQASWRYPQVLTSWGRLHTLLLGALAPGTCRLRSHVVAAESHTDGVRARLADGDALQADLLIACDGIRSTVRGQLAPDVRPVYAGYVAWRGVCDESCLSRLTRTTLFGHFGFGLPDGEQMLGYPVAGAGDRTGPGERRWNFVWYRPAAAGAGLAALMTDADGVHHAGGIAPQQVSWRAVAAMREAAREKLAPQFAEIVEKTAQPFLQPIHDLASSALAFDRIALLGDAAFIARPHVGMGVTKAGDDALALADCIARDGATPAALQRYESIRLWPGRGIVERGRKLGASLEAQHRGQPALRDAAAVMRETAIDPCLFEAEQLTPA